MTQVLVPLADVVAICVLAIGLYYRRYHRRDLTMAYLAVNVGVMGVAIALSATPINAGIGFGLFGVLALVRLRSETLSQREIAYYFCALALGVIGGLGAYHSWLSVGLMALIVTVVAVADSRTKNLQQRVSKVTLTLSQAIADEALLLREVEAIMGTRVREIRLDKVDFVRGLTVVDVRYEPNISGSLSFHIGSASSESPLPPNEGLPDLNLAFTSPHTASPDQNPNQARTSEDLR